MTEMLLMTQVMITALVPIKRNSQRIPNKNFLKLTQNHYISGYLKAYLIHNMLMK